jgi:hypothetical protein
VTLPLIYIAGKFRGPTPYDVRRNVEAARDAGLYVARLGGYPVIPHTMTADFDKQLDDQFWLDGTMELLRRCDAVCLIHNWSFSQGARAEKAEAVRLDLPIFLLVDDAGESGTLARWIVAWKSNRVPIEEAGV